MSVVLWLLASFWVALIAYNVGHARGGLREQQRSALLRRVTSAEDRDAPRDPNAPATVIHLADLRRARNEMQQ